MQAVYEFSGRDLHICRTHTGQCVCIAIRSDSMLALSAAARAPKERPRMADSKVPMPRRSSVHCNQKSLDSLDDLLPTRLKHSADVFPNSSLHGQGKKTHNLFSDGIVESRVTQKCSSHLYPTVPDARSQSGTLLCLRCLVRFGPVRKRSQP